MLFSILWLRRPKCSSLRRGHLLCSLLRCIGRLKWLLMRTMSSNSIRRHNFQSNWEDLEIRKRKEPILDPMIWITPKTQWCRSFKPLMTTHCFHSQRGNSIIPSRRTVRRVLSLPLPVAVIEQQRKSVKSHLWANLRKIKVHLRLIQSFRIIRFGWSRPTYSKRITLLRTIFLC